MSDPDFINAVNYYERSSQVKYVPSPAALWQVLSEIPALREEENRTEHRDRDRLKDALAVKKYKQWTEEKVSAEKLTEHMAAIRRQNPKMFRRA